ncbi:MAG: hypothetical protein GC156_12280 [Actinomycetales bacterium]|nr:hypothetical protein [Actinomycetales bacterium]
MTTFREYREDLDRGVTPAHTLPALPSYAVPLQGNRAGFVSRAIAACIDVLLIFLVVLGTVAVIWMVSFIVQPLNAQSDALNLQQRVPRVAVMILYGYGLNVLYWTVFWATSGRTVGNLVMGLRVVNRKGEHPSWVGAFTRAVFCTVFPIGLAWSIVSGANRSVQDVVLRTSVIYDWVVGIPGLRRSPTWSDTPAGPDVTIGSRDTTPLQTAAEQGEAT